MRVGDVYLKLTTDQTGTVTMGHRSGVGVPRGQKYTPHNIKSVCLLPSVYVCTDDAQVTWVTPGARPCIQVAVLSSYPTQQKRPVSHKNAREAAVKRIHVNTFDFRVCMFLASSGAPREEAGRLFRLCVRRASVSRGTRVLLKRTTRDKP